MTTKHTTTMAPDDPRIPKNLDEGKLVDSDKEESTSRASVYPHLVSDDLEPVLASFEHKGAFHYCSTEARAPNPALIIEGVGLVGLPLSERDAKLVISHASRIFEDEDQIDVGTAGADYWVIESRKVGFQNEKWHEYVEKVASTTVWKALGAAPFTSKPRCELKQLTIYQTGSYSSPSQDTCKEGGAFATVTFVLPSAFESGGVHVSHAVEQAVIDVAKDSKLSTSVTAWYKDVTYEVKPVTSGYRLALSYDLVHTSADKPKPGLPDASVVGARLHRVLREWKQGKYNHAEFNRETRNLRGADALKAAYLLRASQELGFTVYHGHVVYAEYGVAEMVERNYKDEDDGEGPRVRRPTPSPPPMCDFKESIEEYAITGLLRLTGRKHRTRAGFDLRDPMVLTLARPFHEARPDEVEYEGDLYGGGGALQHYYYRSVLFLYREEQELLFWHSLSQSSAWVLREIQLPTHSPDEEVGRITSVFIDKLAGTGSFLDYHDDEIWSQSDRERLSSSVEALVGYAACWKDVNVWNRIFPFCYEGDFSEGFEGVIDKALMTFDFAEIQPGITALIYRVDSLAQRLDLITLISRHPSDTAEPQWADQIAKKALSSYKAGKPADVPRLVALAKVGGLGIIKDTICPSKCGTPQKHEFLCELAKALHKDRNQFTASTPVKLEGTSDSDTLHQLPTLEQVIRECLSIAVQYCSPYGASSCSSLDWVREMVELCFTVGDIHPCVTLLTNVLRSSAHLKVEDRFKKVYEPLIPTFRDTLRAHGHNVALEPFRSFFQNIISTYLASILGDKRSIISAFERTLKCQCKDCRELERWLNNPTSPVEYHLRAKGPKRSHLEDSIRSCAKDLLSYETMQGPPPYTLVVKKQPKALTRVGWEERQAAAIAFLTSIGEEEEWKLVMGERYKDALKAVQGTEAFVLRADIAVTRADVIKPAPAFAPLKLEDSKDSVSPVKPEDSKSSLLPVKLENSKDSVHRLVKAESGGGEILAAVGVKRKRSDSMDSESRFKVKVEAD
ncbi:hypothetical protein H1R20_g2718, partial [Candolleomyces eurysporus]